eukprot:CAMPEP_0201517688 /NCGR_PEP_ID=MMETSP0161_2-20130828/8742_1 /ASSEMBLY_ACC=CAM_ASM_000251 /TAXON_ID=180227 /ORGANISM="Neoparamoeba aestuarina, Strain SoJaBio B1-5/56/2" /LENGTH=363 /DNA_ID=CAMNT_0047915269 /DNA_START=476 /DNA_END=1564 /DNA_ORIENTATION=-
MSWFEGRVADVAPKSRYGAGVCPLDENNRRVIVVGGRNILNEFWGDAWVMDNNDKFSWTSLSIISKQAPPPHSFASVSTNNNKVYLFGGLKENGECEGDLWCGKVAGPSEENPKTIEWDIIQIKKGQPTPRYGHTCNRVGSKLVFFGGSKSGEFFNDIYYFTPDTNTWSKPSCSGIAPEGRCYHTSTLIGNKLYIFGGLGKNKIYSDVFMFDLESDSWTKMMLPGTPKARFGHTATALGNSIIMCGGRTLPSEPVMDTGDGGDLIDSFASGIPVLDTESRGWVMPFGDSIQSEDVAHHSAFSFSTTKVIFIFGLKLVIKKSGRRLNPQLEVINKHRILYHLNTNLLQYSPDGSTSSRSHAKNP